MVARSGYGGKLLKGHGWGVALHGVSSSVVAYVVEASVKDGVPKLHKVTAGEPPTGIGEAAWARWRRPSPTPSSA